mmetsp:Transcript_79464/g.128726  ORF Transcript_79464/g.128726 Transcript_79464/m.128726 type:complete len:290 (-) Transcript_79464:338-1207(-)
MTPNMTRQQIFACKQEGGQAMLALQQTFPVRNMSVAKCVAAIDSPPPTKAPRGGRAKCHSKWGMEKGHAIMAHANESNVVMGNLANTSAQVIEMKHLSIKSDAARTNNKTNWELQVLIKQQRRDHAVEQSWQPKDADDDEDDTEALWVPKCKPRARATFGHSMYSTALRYPVFKVVSQHSQCVRRLAVRAMQPNSRSQLNIITNTLGSAESAYSQDCADLKHLPEAMARHICDKYRHVDPVRFPDRSVQLDHAQIFTLVNLTGRKSGRQHAQMQDGEGSNRAATENAYV